MTGPLRGALPTELRAEIIRVFTQVLSRAVVTGDGGELGRFVDTIVWEAHKIGVAPRQFDAWIRRYAGTVRRLLDDQEWSMTEPMLATAREHIERLQN
jgi:hypothetical protein